jgi:Holliday junction resolvase RusA-like endonuclease
MSEVVSFTVDGAPRPYRERTFIIRGGPANGQVGSRRTEEVQSYQAAARVLAQDAMEGREIMRASVELTVRAYLQIPTSWSLRKQAEARQGLLLPLVTPDLTNVLKCIEDALAGVVFLDDKQVVRQVTEKLYSDAPRLEVEVREIRTLADVRLPALEERAPVVQGALI